MSTPDLPVTNVSGIQQTRGRRRNVVNALQSFYAAQSGDDRIVVRALPFRVLLPPVPQLGDALEIEDGVGTAGTDNITIDGNGKLISGFPTHTIVDDWGTARLEYNGTAWAATEGTPNAVVPPPAFVASHDLSGTAVSQNVIGLTGSGAGFVVREDSRVIQPNPAPAATAAIPRYFIGQQAGAGTNGNGGDRYLEGGLPDGTGRKGQAILNSWVRIHGDGAVEVDYFSPDGLSAVETGHYTAFLAGAGAGQVIARIVIDPAGSYELAFDCIVVGRKGTAFIRQTVSQTWLWTPGGPGTFTQAIQAQVLGPVQSNPVLVCNPVLVNDNANHTMTVTVDPWDTNTNWSVISQFVARRNFP